MPHISHRVTGSVSERVGHVGSWPPNGAGVGCERRASGRKGDGVFTTRPLRVGETVLRGVIAGHAVENDPYAVEVALGEYIYEGGLSPLVNHSCDPNCGVRRNAQGAFDLVVRIPILPDDEITVDYAMHSYVVEYFPEQCLCGSLLCRKEITGWRDLPEARKAAYTGYTAPFLSDLSVRV